MAHVTTPRWLSPASRRIVLIVIAVAAALMLLTSILVTSAAAADPERVRNVKVPACQNLGFGVDTFKETIPRGDADPNYSATFPVPEGGNITLSAPPNRSFVTFTLDAEAVNAGVIVLGAVLFNRTDQKDGNLYDYRSEGGATEGTLEPPPRDQGNEKQVVFCFDAATLDCGDSVEAGGEGLADTPRVGFYVGPLKDEGECAVRVAIATTNNAEDVLQTVFIGPPAGADWEGVTGLLTIEWDAEEATDSSVPRTVQLFANGSSAPVPWCEDLVRIAPVAGEWFYELNPDDRYPTAVPSDGDTCLVLQSTTPVGSDLVQTTEVFYIYNDPILGRPR